MKYVCDAGELTWFQIETSGEAAAESEAMAHAVARYFEEAHDEAAITYRPPTEMRAIEQSIGRHAHIARVMPRFMTLRERDGTARVTAMLPPAGQDEIDVRPIIVGRANGDPYPQFGDAITALARHLGLTLDRERCFPYRRR